MTSNLRQACVTTEFSPNMRPQLCCIGEKTDCCQIFFNLSKIEDEFLPSRALTFRKVCFSPPQSSRREAVIE